MKRFFGLIILIFVFGSVGSSAKGIPDYFVLNGDDMFPMILHLEVALVFDQGSEIRPAPEVSTAPYILRSYIRLENDEIVQFELSPVHYYPAEGFIYFVGRLEDDDSPTFGGASQPFEGRWYLVDAEVKPILDNYITMGRDIEKLQKMFLASVLNLLSS